MAGALAKRWQDARRGFDGLSLPLKLTLAVTFVLLVGTGTYLLWKNATGSSIATGELTSASRSLDSADATVAPLARSASMATLGDDVSDALSVASDDSADAHDSLDAAGQALDTADAISGYLSGHDRELLAALHESLDARRSELDASTALLEEQDRGRQAVDALADASGKTVVAGSYLNGNLSPFDGASDLDRANAATASLDEASSAVSTAQSLYPDADLSSYTDYIAKQREYADLKQQQAQAVVDGYDDLASELQSQADVAQADAAALAAQLPNPPDVLKTAYDAATSDQLATLGEAMRAATAADERLSAIQTSI